MDSYVCCNKIPLTRCLKITGIYLWQLWSPRVSIQGSYGDMLPQKPVFLPCLLKLWGAPGIWWRVAAHLYLHIIYFLCVSVCVCILTSPLDLEPTVIKYEIVFYPCQITSAKTVFPNKSHSEVLGVSEFGGWCYSTHYTSVRTLFLQVPGSRTWRYLFGRTPFWGRSKIQPTTMVEAFQVLGTKAGRVSTESVGVLLILNVPFGGHLVVGRGVGKWNSHSHIERS